MATLVLSGTVVLVVLGFDNPVWWLAAVALLILYVSQAGGRRGTSTTPSGGSAGGGGSPSSYQAYRDRRDQQARWERRYRRERPLESRRQERHKSAGRSKGK
ncbi:hypothetical protein [Streptomyces sp. JW3]|uniref:hypothetical protein n=1 Tax=Streptomyces sp. JW3 TaxID=3456955 RepID=UPI003FA41B59